jgi:tRNA nucleotidyltransferase (CCA-adding enzyme)
MLKEEYPEKMLLRASVLGVLQKMHPELKGDVWLEEKFNQARSINRSPSVALYFSLLVYHLSQEKVEDLVGCLNIPKTVALVIKDTLHTKEILPSLANPKLSPSVIYRLLERYHPLSIQANAIASDSELLSQRLYLYLDKLRNVRTSLNGVELKNMGVPPGTRMGEILRELHDAKLNQVVKTREEEEELVHLLLSKGE